MKNWNWKLIRIFILALAIRLSLLFFDYSWDVNNHIVWAYDLHTRGFLNFYTIQSSNVFATIYPNYPPLSMFMFYAVYLLQSVIHSIAWFLNTHISVFPSNLIFFLETKTFLAGLMKLPAIFADLGLAYICYLFALKLIKKNASVIALLILFNPVFIFNSSLWGQIDSIPLLFVLWAFYILFYTKKSLLSGVLFAISLLIKPTSLLFLPVYIFALWKRTGSKTILKISLLSIILFYLCFAPFHDWSNPLTYPVDTYFAKILEAQSLKFVTNGAFNFWGVFTPLENPVDTSLFLFGLPFRYWGYGAVLSFLLLFIKKMWRSNKPEQFLLMSFFFSMTAFLFLTRMHERYALLPLPFLLLASTKYKTLQKSFYILSFIAFFNHYINWTVPMIPFITNALKHPYVGVFFSALNVIVFFNAVVKMRDLNRQSPTVSKD